MNINKNLIALALASALTACGDSSDDSTTKTDPATDIPVITETTINGKAIKGVLTNAVVTVYKFVDGNPIVLTDTELKDANVSTDGEGNYTFTVLDYTGPIKVELSPSTDAANPTKMTCDAPAGCGDVAFGQEINLTSADPSFKLAAISLVDADAEVKLNVSALTHLASKLIEADEDGINTTTIAAQSSKIANTFGITGDITLLEPTVTDDAAAVAAEDNNDELKYGLINAGIMAALFSGETDDAGILSSKLAEVAADLVENDGAFLVNQDEDDGFELALAEVLEGAAESAKAAAEQIAADDTLTIILNLAQLETQLVNEQAFQESNVGYDGRATVVVDVLTQGDAVAKAQAMVEDVRLFTHLFNDETSDGAGIKSQGDEYVALLEAAGTMVEAEADSFELIAKLSDALSAMSTAHDEETITKAAAAAGISISTYIDGATGIVTFEEETATGGILFTVEATSGSEKALLNVSAEFSEDNKSITLTIDGLVESAGAKFTLNEGSFAKVNLDTAASRTALDDDTYEGEIVSGELELALSLAQKATDAVPNPVTFEGMVKTKLLLIEERILNENWEWDDQKQQSTASYGRPELDSLVLPETLSLSGAFNSLEGDAISATITVNIDDLATYEAPEFKYIGKEVANLVNITTSGDSIVWTEADNVSDEEQATLIYSLSHDAQAGNWTGSRSFMSKNAEEHWSGMGNELKHFSRTEDIGLDVPSLVYTLAYISDSEETSFWAKSVRITPVDENGDEKADGYHFERITTTDGQYNGLVYNTEEMLNSDGSINLAALVNSNGEILTAGGQQEWTNVQNLNTYLTVEDFLQERPWEFVGNPYTLTTNAEYFANSLNEENSLIVDDIGKAVIFFNEEELAEIATGEFTELNPTAYLTQSLIKDVVTVEVSEDANSVSYLIENGLSREFTFSGAGNGNFTAEIATTDLEAGEEHHTATKTIVSSTEDIGLNVDKVRLNITESHTAHPTDPNSGGHQIIITPKDHNGDGNAEQFVARHEYGDHFNANGELVDESNGIIVPNSIYEIFDSYEEVYWNEPSFANDVPFNPLTVNSAIELFKNIIVNESRSPYVWVDDVGRLEVTLSDEDLDSVIANSTTKFDGYNTEADDKNILEDENTFLDINAALTLEAILGDYQVKLQLSGERSALEEGTFDLNMSYRLPGADTQRSFTAHYNTEVEGRLTANNADGVVLVLNESDEDATGTQVLGQILVGPTAIVAATIEDRDGAIFIVYADIDNDGVQEEESL